MRPEDFPQISVDRPGSFRVVPDETLRSVLNAASWVLALNIPSSGLEALGFALRYFRTQKDLSLRDLSEATGVHRDRISQAEEGVSKRGPQPETLGRLAVVLGDDFRAVAIALGYDVQDSPKEKSG